MCCASSLFADGPTTHWVGPETLVSLKVEGHKINALADSGSQVNMVMPGYVHQHEFPVLPLEDLVHHPLNLIGLDSMRTRPLGFMILQDIVFLVVPDKSEFSRCVPLVMGTYHKGNAPGKLRFICEVGAIPDPDLGV